MTERNGAFNEAALHAFADERLPAEERADVAAYLAAYPEQAARIEAWRRQSNDLRKAYDPITREPIPASLMAAAHGGGRASVGRAIFAIAATITVLLAGGLAGWLIHESYNESQRQAQVQDFVQRAAVAHTVYEPEVKHPVEVGAGQLDHLVGWLSKRLGTKISAPVLAKAGFNLVGGRLLPDATSPAAQFMYQNKEGRRVTLYLRVAAKKNRETAFLWHQQGDLLTCYWMDGPVGYALTGRIPWKDMEALSKLVYDQTG